MNATPHDVWAAPGPGTWERDQSHFLRSVTPIMSDLMEQAAPVGIREGFDLVGAPLDTMEIRFVNGQMYRRLVPIIGGSGKGPSKPPPPAVLKLAFKLHPKLRRRAAVAAESMEAKSYLAEAERWESDWKPHLIAENRRLGAVDVADLDDGALADHFEACHAHLRHGVVLHFRLHISDLGPIASLLSRTGEWGLEPVDVMSVLAGSSPATSAPRDALRPLAAELHALDVEPASFDEIRAASPAASALLDGYLSEFGSRLTGGYDLVDLTLAELPMVTIAALRDDGLLDGTSTAADASARGSEAVARLRRQVPVGDVEEFDELVDEARLLYGLRDENGPLTVEWPAGVVRLVMLEAGKRLESRAALPSAEHVFELSAVEVAGLLRNRTGLRPDVVDRRRTTRRGYREGESPAHLGPAPVEPSLDGLPEAMATMMQMTIEVVTHLEAVPEHGHLAGTGIGTRTHRGVARVVTDAADAFERSEPGDVIVTTFTAPTFNSVLAMAGAVVTEQGGLLCHTAVIARELGIAAVVGVDGAMQIPDGADVEVDPVAGTVTIL